MQVLHASLFDTGADALVNPVNCRGVLGAGLAKAFKARFPAAYATAYAAACRDGRLRPGSLVAWRDPGARTTVISLATKDDWRQPSRLEWIDSGLVQLARWAVAHRPSHLALPALGCGLGGLRLADVRPLIHARLDRVPARVSLCLPGPGA